MSEVYGQRRKGGKESWLKEEWMWVRLSIGCRMLDCNQIGGNPTTPCHGYYWI